MFIDWEKSMGAAARRAGLSTFPAATMILCDGAACDIKLSLEESSDKQTFPSCAHCMQCLLRVPELYQTLLWCDPSVPLNQL